MKKTRGFTLVELMIVIAIAAIGITLAVPSFRDMIERKQLSGATEAAFQHLRRAKSQAVKRSKPILVDFYVNGADGTDWAIGFTDKMAGCNAEDTSGADLCTVDENNDIGGVGDLLLAMRVVSSDFKNVTMSQAVGFVAPAPPVVTPDRCPSLSINDEQACFDFLRGLARTGQYDFASTNYNLRIQVTLLGNVQVCVPALQKKIPGYADC